MNANETVNRQTQMSSSKDDENFDWLLGSVSKIHTFETQSALK